MRGLVPRIHAVSEPLVPPVEAPCFNTFGLKYGAAWVAGTSPAKVISGHGCDPDAQLSAYEAEGKLVGERVAP